MFIPYFITDNENINRAFRIATGDIIGNIIPYRDGLLENDEAVIMAGIDYDTPWTRDAAINTWNGAGLLIPEVTRSTLLSVLEVRNKKLFIAGQYWDAIIWVIGAWWQYLFTGDKEFLAIAYKAACNSLEYLEASEFDPDRNLFRGPAVYGDGVAAYPDIYTNTNGSGCILDWPKANPEIKANQGYGIPMYALSTNCLYYYAYILTEKIAGELKLPIDRQQATKAAVLREAINRYFWDHSKGYYRYLVDPFGGCEYQEGLGHSFAVLFGVADVEKIEKIFQNQHITNAGIPCVWPTFGRYEGKAGMSLGRHSGTVWPHIQAFWAHASLEAGKVEAFEYELNKLAEHACRDSQFAEIYHPVTEEIYGGLQEGENGCLVEWKSCSRQTWSATGFVRMVLMGLIGMTFEPDKITFNPNLPCSVRNIEIKNLHYRNMIIDISIEGQGSSIVEFRMNGRLSDVHILRSTDSGRKEISIKMSVQE